MSSAMESFVNVIELAVIQEATKQLAALPESDRGLVSLEEVVTYSLNRVPPMYATSLTGWTHLYKRIEVEMGCTLENVIYWAIRNIITNERNRTRGIEPERDRTPLPETALAKPARALHKLSQILEEKYLEWSQVPSSTQKAIAAMTRIQTSTPTQLPAPDSDYGSRFTSGANRALITSMKGYLQRAHVKAQRPDQAKAWQRSEQVPQKLEPEVSPESSAKQMYMASSRLGYVNVMEEVVTAAAKSLVKSVRMGLQSKIQLHDVVACALNLLPAMYASSEFGMKFLRYKIKTEMIDTISSMVRQAIVQVCKAPIRKVLPTPIAEIEQQQSQAIAELQTILKRLDISWENVVSLIETELNLSSATNLGTDDSYFHRAGIA
jgi:Late competence development protein ComFB